MIKKIGLVLFASIALVACGDNEKAWKPISPLNTTSLLNMYALQDNYEEFNALYMNGTDTASTEESFSQIKGIATPNAGIDNFTTLSFDNGEMVIIHLTPVPNEKGEVLIQSIVKVPEEMKAFIRDAISQPKPSQ